MTRSRRAILGFAVGEGRGYEYPVASISVCRSGRLVSIVSLERIGRLTLSRTFSVPNLSSHTLSDTVYHVKLSSIATVLAYAFALALSRLRRASICLCTYAIELTHPIIGTLNDSCPRCETTVIM